MKNGWNTAICKAFQALQCTHNIKRRKGMSLLQDKLQLPAPCYHLFIVQ